VSTVPTRVRVALSVCTIQGSLRYSIGKYPEPSGVQGLLGGAAIHTSIQTCNRVCNIHPSVSYPFAVFTSRLPEQTSSVPRAQPWI
jgi:hypothetical protein